MFAWLSIFNVASSINLGHRESDSGRKGSGRERERDRDWMGGHEVDRGRSRECSVSRVLDRSS